MFLELGRVFDVAFLDFHDLVKAAEFDVFFCHLEPTFITFVTYQFSVRSNQISNKCGKPTAAAAGVKAMPIRTDAGETDECGCIFGQNYLRAALGLCEKVEDCRRLPGRSHNIIFCERVNKVKGEKDCFLRTHSPIYAIAF